MAQQLAKRMAFIGAWFIYPFAVAAAPCPVLVPPAAVSVEFRRADVHEVVDTSRDELDRLAIAAGKQEHRPMLGMYTALLGYDVDTDSHVEQVGDDLFCAVPTGVRIVIFLSGRVIHLAHEVRSNGCLYDAAREHAWLHAHADERALAEKASTLSDALRRALAETPLASGTSRLTAKSQMLATIGAQLNRQLDSVEQLRKQLNRSIDTPSTLARLHAACGMQMSEPL